VPLDNSDAYHPSVTAHATVMASPMRQGFLPRRGRGVMTPDRSPGEVGEE
jgi:hypothetical protein